MTMADKKRRRSIRNVFKRPETPPATPSLPSGPPSPVERRVDFFVASPDVSENSSPRIRPRTLQKANRTSVFGSLRSLHSLDEDERTNLTRTDSKASSINEDGHSPSRVLLGEKVIRHGDVQIAGTSMFRKRSHYLVLTESHLIRFKSVVKAADMFPILSHGISRPFMPRGSTSSIGSLSDLQMTAYNDATQSVALDQVVAVYSLEGRQFPIIELSYLDEHPTRSSTLQLQFNEPREIELWIKEIRETCASARQSTNRLLHNRIIDYIARILESQNDYDPLHFRIFRAAQLSSFKVSGRSSSDDVSKTATTVCYLAIGISKIHFIPLSRGSKRSSSTSLAESESPISIGIANLTLVKLHENEDTFELQFKHPAGGAYNLQLASSSASDIVLWLRFASEYIRPQWIIQPFVFDVPKELDDKMDPPNFPLEDYNCFDRTLIAYSAAYDVHASKITYTVDYDCEDAPCFRLLPPIGSAKYSSMELLAVMRALRYNEFFHSISFADIDLRPLRDLYDPAETDIDCQSTRTGNHLNLPGQSNLSALSREVRALALKSKTLRRFDFTNTMSASPRNSDEVQPCEIPLALAPLAKKSLTNVDWIVLNGIQLAEADLDHLVDAASERLCHIRALEVGGCGLSVHDIDVLLSTLAVHEHTLEVIDVSGALGRFSPELFQRAIGPFTHIRKLNLARCQKTAGSEPLIAPEIFLGWRLESLNLSQTTLNEQMIDSLSTYLASPISDTLRKLSLDQCGLTGTDLAFLLQAMTRVKGLARNMHLSANENRLGVGSTSLSRCITENYGPSSLSMRMMDFEKEHHFRDLINALSINSTLRSLDLSRVSLPYEASEDTCESLKEMFASNQTLEELDISGEHTHLDTARFGIGLNIALLGLAKNRVLRMLRIEHQSLGLQGANTLASVLESNKSLLEIHCEHNDINLQSFTVLVNALRKNKNLLYLPRLTSDKAKSIEKVQEEFEKSDKVISKDKNSAKSSTLKKGITALSHKAVPRPSHPHSHHRKSSSLASNISFTEQDIAATLAALEERWQAQISRMQQYLIRNYNIAAGVSPPEEDEFDTTHINFSEVEFTNESRPATTESLGKLLAKVKIDRTPTVERPGLLDAWDLNSKVPTKDGNVRQELVFQLPQD